MKFKTLIFFERDMKKIKLMTELFPLERWKAVRDYAEANDVSLAPELLLGPEEGRRMFKPGVRPFEAIEEPLKRQAYAIEKIIREAVWTQRKLCFSILGAALGILSFFGLDSNTVAKLFSDLIHAICHYR